MVSDPYDGSINGFTRWWLLGERELTNLGDTFFRNVSPSWKVSILHPIKSSGVAIPEYVNEIAMF